MTKEILGISVWVKKTLVVLISETVKIFLYQVMSSFVWLIVIPHGTKIMSLEKRTNSLKENFEMETLLVAEIIKLHCV